MENLRKEVRKLEEEDMFDSVAQKNAGPAFAKDPSARDIDAIMQRMVLSEPPATAAQYALDDAQTNVANLQAPGDGLYGEIGRGFPLQRR